MQPRKRFVDERKVRGLVGAQQLDMIERNPGCEAAAEHASNLVHFADGTEHGAEPSFTDQARERANAASAAGQGR